MRLASKTVSIVFALALAVAPACESDSNDGGGADAADSGGGGADAAGDDGGEHDPLAELAEHACAHFQTGPFEAVTAGADAEAAPEIHPGHALFQITLAANGADNGGFLEAHIEAPGELVFMLSKAVPVTLTDADGAAVTPEEEPDLSPHCGAIAQAHVVHVHEAGALTIALGPTAETDVDLVIGGLDEHEHEE